MRKREDALANNLWEKAYLLIKLSVSVCFKNEEKGQSLTKNRY